MSWRIKNSWLPIIGLLMAMFLWSSSFIALKLAFRTYDPMLVIFGRMVIASFFFLFLIRRGSIHYQRGDWKPILLMAFFEPCLYFLFEAGALCRTTASQAGVIVAILPLLVAVSARIILKEIISRRTMIGFVLAILGAIWLSMAADSSEYAPRPALGNFLEFMAMVSTTGYIITLKKLSVRYSPLFLTAGQAFVGSVFFFPLVFSPWAELPSRFEIVPVLAIVYLGTFVTMGAYGLYNYGVSRIPASQATAFTNLIPVFTLILSWLILGETLNVYQYLAIALVFCGVLVSQDRKSRDSNESRKKGISKDVSYGHG